VKNLLLATLVLTLTSPTYAEIRNEPQDKPGRLCTSPDDQLDCENPPREPLPPCVPDKKCYQRSFCVDDESPAVWGCCGNRDGSCDTAPPRTINALGGTIHGWPLLLDRKTATFYASVDGVSLSMWPLEGAMSLGAMLEISARFTAETGDTTPLLAFGLYVTGTEGEPRLYSLKNPQIFAADFVSNLGSRLELIPAGSLRDKRRWGK